VATRDGVVFKLDYTLRCLLISLKSDCEVDSAAGRVQTVRGTLASI